MTEKNHLPRVTLTTDGAARGNPGPGGWAALLEANQKERLIVGEEPQPTTNNAMEIFAAIGGLEALKKSCHVTLRADSQYVLNGLERLLAGGKLPTKNRDLWQRLLTAAQRHQIQGEWVRGHSGDPRNERVNEAANAAAARAYQQAEEATSANTARSDDWTIALLSPAAGRPVTWAAIAPTGQQTGSQPVDKGMTQPTAIYHALIAALNAAIALSGSQEATLVVRSNYELIIKQGRGEWKVKQPEQQPLAAQAVALRNRFANVRFEFADTESVRGLIAAYS